MKRREALKKTLLAMGYTISIPSLISIFESCTNNSSQSWQPQFFSTQQATVIGELVETILPKTKTPGAKDLKLDQFIDQLVKKIFLPADQQHFLSGMETFEKTCKEMNGKSFIDCNTDQRNKLLTKLEQETDKVPGSIWGFSLENDARPIPFYRRVKDMTLLGYFTSKEIGKEVLVYNPVPGKFVADMPLGQTHISFE